MDSLKNKSIIIYINDPLSLDYAFPLMTNVILSSSWDFMSMQLIYDMPHWQENAPETYYSISLVTSEWIRNNIKENPDNLSFAIPDLHKCFINYDRWSGSHLPKEDRISLWQYRYYLINHEFGHLLGLKHPPHSWMQRLKGKYTPVMNQHTIKKVTERIPLYKPSDADFLDYGK